MNKNEQMEIEEYKNRLENLKEKKEIKPNDIFKISKKKLEKIQEKVEKKKGKNRKESESNSED